MSNGELIRCPVKEEYEELLKTPANQVIKNLKFKNSQLKKANESLREKIEELKESNLALQEEPSDIRKELRAVRALAERKSQILNDIKKEFIALGHPLAPGEREVEKLRNLVIIIRGKTQIIEEMKAKQEKKKNGKNSKN